MNFAFGRVKFGELCQDPTGSYLPTKIYFGPTKAQGFVIEYIIMTLVFCRIRYNSITETKICSFSL